MKQFEITLEDKPGELAKLATQISNINIRNMTVTTGGGEGSIRLITMDEEATRSTLKSAGVDFTEDNIILVELQNKPGQLAKLAKRLGDAGINIVALYLIDRGLFGLLVDPDNHTQARNLLKDIVIEA